MTHHGLPLRVAVPVCLAALLIGVTVGPPDSAADSGPVTRASLPKTLEAWIYPTSAGQPACDTSSELTAMAAHPIAILKPEYFSVSNGGKVVEETAPGGLTCNGFSAANLAKVRTAAKRIYVTVSAGSPAVATLLDNPGRLTSGEATIEHFVSTNHLDGVDLDFEPKQWVESDWHAFVTFMSGIATSFRGSGRTVEVDLDGFTTTPWDAERYADVSNAGAHLVVMAYDDEYGVACAPITPYAWLRAVTAYAKRQVPVSDLTIGIPSYGYFTTTCSQIAHITDNVAYVNMAKKPGFPSTAAAVNAVRNSASGELRWTSGGVHYDAVDATALNDKLAVVEQMGISDVSVWSLGGQPWFNGNP
jgi:spore germination protein YaaH